MDRVRWSKVSGYWVGMLVGLFLLLMTLPAHAHASSNVLTWLDNANNEQNFEVWSKIIPTPSPGVVLNCAADPILYTLLATVGPNTTTLPLTTFVHANVIDGTTYCYKVRATNSAGVSAFSNQAGRTVPFSVPAAPSDLGVGGGL